VVHPVLAAFDELAVLVFTEGVLALGLGAVGVPLAACLRSFGTVGASDSGWRIAFALEPLHVAKYGQ
jgi:hypothetical protein